MEGFQTYMQKNISHGYNKIFKEQEHKVSTGITKEAREHTPLNAVRIVGANMFTKLGDALSSPKTVLAWLMGSAGVPVSFISLIVPIREAGSMIFHTLIASFIQTYAYRRWVWIIGALVQGMAISGIGLASLWYQGVTFGWIVIGLLIIFSLARGLCSVSSKDVLGKTIPKTRRGRINGWSSSLSGILIFMAGGWLVAETQRGSQYSFSWMLVAAGGLWFLATIIYYTIKEFPGETKKHAHVISESFRKLGLIIHDRPLRKFIIARGFLLCSALVTPFYLSLGQRELGTDLSLLGAFVILNGVGNVLGGPLWGSFADKSSKKVMAFAGGLSALIGGITLMLLLIIPSLKQNLWLYLIGFLLLVLAHEGVRLGRKTYVVDIAEGTKRSTYVAVSNTAIGCLLLLVGGLSAIFSIISLEFVILTLSFSGIIGSYVSYHLKEA